MCQAEVVRDFFLSWARAKPFSPMVAGEQHDAVEALMHIVEECGLTGDCLRTGHAAHPDGVIMSPLPEGFSARHSCSVQELVQTALLDDNALEHCPEVLCIAFSNMYEEADVDWWVDLKLTGIDDVIDLSPCSRQCTDSLYHLRVCVIHRHSGMASKTMTSGHYIAQFPQAQNMT